MFIDTHSHLNFNIFNGDRKKVIERTLKSDVWMINVGTNYLTSKKAIEITEDYPKGVFAAVGLHPINLDTGLIKSQKSKMFSFAEDFFAKGEQIKNQNLEDVLEKSFDYNQYKKLSQSPKVIAIGEIGLDYYWRPKTTKKRELFKEKQKELLLQQLDLAKELNLPIILHCRMAHQDLIEVLKSKINGVIHCFTGTWEEAKEYLKMDFYLGFNGLIFKMVFDEIIKNTPLEKILIETDCPYLTPPLPADLSSDLSAEARRAKVEASAKAEASAKEGPATDRNEPLYVKHIAQKIAEIKNLSFEEVAEKTSENAKKLFNLR